MKKREEFQKTTNRYVYNRRRKEQLASCSYCGWHRGENDRRNCYQYFTHDKYKVESIIISNTYEKRKYTFSHLAIYHKVPNWKLVSKNKKQWEHKEKLRKVYSSEIYPDRFIYKW